VLGPDLLVDHLERMCGASDCHVPDELRHSRHTNDRADSAALVPKDLPSGVCLEVVAWKGVSHVIVHYYQPRLLSPDDVFLRIAVKLWQRAGPPYFDTIASGECLARSVKVLALQS